MGLSTHYLPPGVEDIFGMYLRELTIATCAFVSTVDRPITDDFRNRPALFSLDEVGSDSH